jgi:hypothetical protein
MNNIRIDLGEVGWCGVDWIGLAEDRNRWRALMNSVMDGKPSSDLTVVASRVVLGSLELYEVDGSDVLR